MTKKDTTPEIKKITISAKGRGVGRVASEAARILMDKNSPRYTPNIVPPLALTITDVAALSIFAPKKQQKTYARYSGYPGGLVKERMEQVIAKKGVGEVLRLAIYGMLPPNKLRAVRMKQLTLID